MKGYWIWEVKCHGAFLPNFNHLYLIRCGVWVNIYFWYLNVLLLQHHLLKSPSFLHWIAFPSLFNICLYICYIYVYVYITYKYLYLYICICYPQSQQVFDWNNIKSIDWFCYRSTTLSVLIHLYGPSLHLIRVSLIYYTSSL